MPPKTTDPERASRVQQALRDAALDAVVCALPTSVLLLTGYWPIVGDSVAVCVRDGPTVLLVPEDERELASGSFADSVETFSPGSLRELTIITDAVRPRLAAILHQLKIPAGSVGIDCGPSSQPASYLALHLYGRNLPALLAELLPGAAITPIDRWFSELESIKTPFELSRIRQACAIAQRAYELGAMRLHPGLREPEAVVAFRTPLSVTEVAGPPIHRHDGFVFCMSGPNSAKAFAAYARTGNRTLEADDLVMIHCNSYVDGFWTDITRTYNLRLSDERQSKMHAAVFAARKAALDAIKPGVPAVEVDLAARQVMRDCGFAKDFKHATGHGVGFSPMSAYSIPSIHPESHDVLQEGMVFNVEPAVYIEGYGGVRHCDMVTVTGDGYELLTDFQADIESLTLTPESRIPARAAFFGRS